MLRRPYRLLIVLLCSSTFAATVDPPQRVKLLKLDRTEVAGLITSYSDEGFEVMDGKKQMSKVGWDELPPDAVVNLHDRLMRKPTAEDWFALGKKLLTMPGGRGPAERAFGKALRADPKMKEQIITARKEAKMTAPPAPLRPSPPVLTGQPESIDKLPTTERSPFDPRDPQKKIIGPQKVGPVDASAWGKLMPQQQAEAVAGLKQFAADATQQLGINLAPYETEFFLFYSDLPPADAQKWVSMLDRMYGRLSLLFAVPPGENLWHGKALVFVFSREEDYLKFQIKSHKSVAVGTAGMCHTYGSGDVHIAFYRQPNDMDFAHVLVHESIHGFLHRYRSPIDIPSWANEGLAEAIATDMVPRKGLAQSALAEARQELQTRKSLEKMFESDHIVAWQYPIARTLSEFMIRTSKQGYVDFINAIKDGMAWEEALTSKYGVTPEQLVNAYGNSLAVAGLKP